MENFKECPVCGSTEIRQGRQMGAASMYPMILASGSNIIANICSDCGHILSMKVESPEKFK